MKKRDILRMLPEEIDRLFAGRGLDAYRSAQITEWLYEHNARSFAAMTNLPKRLREELAEEFFITDIHPLKVQVSEGDRTKKILFGMDDGMTVETVLMPEAGRSTVCVSTQVGCAFGCVFCASGSGGLARDLTVGEIVDQARWARDDPDAGRLTNIVLMGMGEPLANYDATVKAIRIFIHERCFALGKRRVTISTAGYAPGIRRLAEEDLPVRLALSLHATDNSTRTRLMPINRKYPIEEALDACALLTQNRRAPLTIEYMLMRDVNDSLIQARKLAKICVSFGAKVNLIECNKALSGKFSAPPRERILEFQTALREAGVLAFIRRSRGLDIEGACGQLRASGAHGSVSSLEGRNAR